MLKRKFTPINEAARAELNISRDEYAFCSYVLYRQADPRQKIKGFCCDLKEELAKFVGITRPGLYKMIDRMIKRGLMDVDETNGNLSATAYFIDVENDCKQSLQSEFLADSKSVNLVDNDCKLSLHNDSKSVNLVTPIIGIERDKEKEKERKAPQSDAEPQKEYSKQSQVERLRSVYKYAQEQKNTMVTSALSNTAFRELWTRYIVNRTSVHKKKYKTVFGEYTQINNFVKIATDKTGLNMELAEKIFQQTKANEWVGLIPLKAEDKTQNNTPAPAPHIPVFKGGMSFAADLS